MPSSSSQLKSFFIVLFTTVLALLVQKFPNICRENCKYQPQTDFKHACPDLASSVLAAGIADIVAAAPQADGLHAASIVGAYARRSAEKPEHATQRQQQAEEESG